MSQYYPGQQSDHDIRCDEGMPTRPAPEKSVPPAPEPTPAAAAHAPTTQAAPSAADATPPPADSRDGTDAPLTAPSDATPADRPEAEAQTTPNNDTTSETDGTTAPAADAAATKPAPGSDPSDAPHSANATMSAPEADPAPRDDADIPPAAAAEKIDTSGRRAAPGTTAHIDPVPDDEDIPVLEVAPPPSHSRPAGRAQQLFLTLSKVGPLALLVLLAVQIWPIFLTGGRFCPAEWPSVLAALSSLGSGDWLCPIGPQGAQLPLLFWIMGGLHHLLSLGGLPDLLIFPVTSALCGALTLLAVWTLSRAAGSEAQAALAGGLILLSSLLFPLLAHFMGPQVPATALTIFSLACLCRGWQKTSSPLLLPAGFLLAGLAGLCGGLAYLALPPLTSLVWLLWRLRLGRAQRLDAVLGFLLMLLSVAIWLLALIILVEADSYLQSVVRHFWHWPFPLEGRWWLPLAAGLLGVGPWLALVPFVSWPRVLRQAPHDLAAGRHENCGSSFLWIALVLSAPLSLLAPGLSGSGPLLCLLAILLGRALLRLTDLGSRIFFLVVALLFLHAGMALTACGFTVTLDWLVNFTSLTLTPEQREVVSHLSGLPVLGILGILCAVILARLVRRGWPGGALLICTLLACVLAQPAHLLLTPQLGAQPSVPLPSAAELQAFLTKRNEQPLPPWYPAPIDLNALPPAAQTPADTAPEAETPADAPATETPADPTPKAELPATEAPAAATTAPADAAPEASAPTAPEAADAKPSDADADTATPDSPDAATGAGDAPADNPKSEESPEPEAATL